MLLVPGYSAPQIVIQVLCMIVKTNIAASIIIAYLQAVELFPTVVRMSGMGLCHIVSQVCIFYQIVIVRCHRHPFPAIATWSKLPDIAEMISYDK